MRMLGHQTAPSASIAPGCFVGARTGLTIGENTFINYRCFFELSAPITIGSEVAVGFGTQFVTTSHRIGPPTRRAGEAESRPITVGDGCWIGSGVQVLPGVSIAPGVIVAAGSVVTRDLETPALYGGVPARKIRDL